MIPNIKEIYICYQKTKIKNKLLRKN